MTLFRNRMKNKTIWRYNRDVLNRLLLYAAVYKIANRKTFSSDIIKLLLHDIDDETGNDFNDSS